MNMSVTGMFTEVGGRLFLPQEDFVERLRKIQCFVFDWDGVFTDGRKFQGNLSSFSEIDSMGLNLLRFGWYLMTGQVPVFAIITGLNNVTAIEFAKRERFNVIFQGFLEKNIAFDFFLKEYQQEPQGISYFFDDVLDIPVCKDAGLRFQMGRRNNPGFNQFIQKHQLADYFTASAGGSHALRECSELCLMLAGLYEQAIGHRLNFTDTYRKYWQLRQQTALRSFVHNSGSVREMPSV